MKKMRALLVLASLQLATASAFAMSGPAEEQPSTYHPGKEQSLPGAHNDVADTYKYWKDEKTVEKSIADGVDDRYLNYRNIRWLKQDEFNGEMVVEQAAEIFNKPGSNGKSCASCHTDTKNSLVGVSAVYPKYNKSLNRMVGLVSQVEHCAKTNTKTEIPVDSKENTLLVTYINHLSHDMPINVDVTSKEGKASFERGRDLFYKRNGQFHFACASCHTPPTVLKQLRGMRPSTVYGDASSYPIWEFPNSPDRAFMYTVQHQIMSCSKNARMKLEPEGSPEYTDMETYLRAISNGHKIKSVSSYFGETID